MKIIVTLMMLVCLAVSAGTVLADCLYNGYWYPTGTNIGGGVCQPDGSWR